MRNVSFLRCLFFTLTFFCSQATGLAAPIPPASQPNVVMITLDTVRADHLASYGYTLIQTPALDGLAAAGTRFSNAYTPVPITLPAHSVILTGEYPMRTAMHDFSGNRLNSKLPTLASVLRENGYATGASIGSAVLDSRFGLDRGFDFYYDHYDFSRLDEKNLDSMMRPGDQVVDHALGWLSRQKTGKPFLLWVHLYDAHEPYNPPARFRQKYRTRPYDACIAFVDEQVGRVISYLKTKGLYDKTLIVVAADHGEGLGEHGEKTHGFFIYDSTTHIPLIIKPAAGSAARKPVVTEAVNLADVTPTILELAGVAIPKEVQGRSLVTAMEGRGAFHGEEQYSETYLPRIHFNWSELRGLRFRQYHFIDAPKPELYDLATDPKELHNLYASRRAAVNEMRKRLQELIARYTPSTGESKAEKTGLDPAMMERLKSLGYVAVGGGGDEVLSDRRLADPKDRIPVYELVSDAMSDSQHGKYPESIEKLKKAEAIEEESLPVHYLLAQNYYRLHESPKAIEEFQQTLKLSPDYSLAHYFLGMAYAQAGDFEAAAGALQKTLELDGTNYSAAFNLGAAQLRMGKTKEAEESFRRATEIQPRYAQAHEALGEILLYDGRTEEAIASLRTAIEIEPHFAKAHMTLAKALRSKGLEREADEEMRKAQEERMPATAPSEKP